MPDIGIPGGPLVSLKWGNMTLHPTQDASPEKDYGGTNYEVKQTGDKYIYLEATILPATLVIDITINEKDFNTLSKKKGKILAGTASTQSGDVLTFNMAINGELKNTNGTVSLSLGGTMRLQ